MIGRFINADGLASTGQGFIGYNMFAYCLNNPVCRNDVPGTTSVEVHDDGNPTNDDEDIHGGKMGDSSGGGYNNYGELSNSELRSFGTQGINDGFRVVDGSSDDAMRFVHSQTQSLSEYAPGKYVGYNSRGVEFRIYDRVGYGYTSIRIRGVQGLRGIKFIWD